jgi:hypothetical protein
MFFKLRRIVRHFVQVLAAELAPEIFVIDVSEKTDLAVRIDRNDNLRRAYRSKFRRLRARRSLAAYSVR